ncbi:hypothetical protein PR048_022918 [Dryococelus australis]|uniref:Uncharacterized protein n=1 Tax=Dryococelus australis TaxID=614101 RepID=A0ABQ9GSP7_9NEOP|nr:hypothetical protein PR048_022918 [Dryococelus australis]
MPGWTIIFPNPRSNDPSSEPGFSLILVPLCLIVDLIDQGLCSPNYSMQRPWGRGGLAANRVKSPAGSLRNFACRNRAVRWRWSVGFLGDLPFSPSFHSGAAPFSPHFTFIGSQDLDVIRAAQISQLNYSGHTRANTDLILKTMSTSFQQWSLSFTAEYFPELGLCAITRPEAAWCRESTTSSLIYVVCCPSRPLLTRLAARLLGANRRQEYKGLRWNSNHDPCIGNEVLVPPILPPASSHLSHPPNLLSSFWDFRVIFLGRACCGIPGSSLRICWSAPDVELVVNPGHACAATSQLNARGYSLFVFSQPWNKNILPVSWRNLEDAQTLFGLLNSPSFFQLPPLGASLLQHNKMPGRLPHVKVGFSCLESNPVRCDVITGVIRTYLRRRRGRGGVVVRLLAINLGVPVSIPGFSHAGVVPDDIAGQRVFSGMSRFPRPCIPALLPTHVYSPPWVLKTSTLRVALSPHSLTTADQARAAIPSELRHRGGLLTALLCLAARVVATLGHSNSLPLGMWLPESGV